MASDSEVEVDSLSRTLDEMSLKPPELGTYPISVVVQYLSPDGEFWSAEQPFLLPEAYVKRCATGSAVAALRCGSALEIAETDPPFLRQGYCRVLLYASLPKRANLFLGLTCEYFDLDAPDGDAPGDRKRKLERMPQDDVIWEDEFNRRHKRPRRADADSWTRTLDEDNDGDAYSPSEMQLWGVPNEFVPAYEPVWSSPEPTLDSTRVRLWVNEDDRLSHSCVYVPLHTRNLVYFLHDVVNSVY